jgi:hypothetical protein
MARHGRFSGSSHWTKRGDIPDTAINEFTDERGLSVWYFHDEPSPVGLRRLACAIATGRDKIRSLECIAIRIPESGSTNSHFQQTPGKTADELYAEKYHFDGEHLGDRDIFRLVVLAGRRGFYLKVPVFDITAILIEGYVYSWYVPENISSARLRDEIRRSIELCTEH